MVINRMKNGTEGVSEIDSMRYSSQSFVAGKAGLTELSAHAGKTGGEELADHEVHDYNEEDMPSDYGSEHSYDS